MYGGSDGNLYLEPYKVEVNCANKYISEVKGFEIYLGTGKMRTPTNGP